MNLSSCIAIFFSVIFFGKFLVMDSKLLIAVFDAEEIAFVTLFCENQQNKKEFHSTSEDLFEKQQAPDLIFDSICNAPFQAEFFAWINRIQPEEPGIFIHKAPGLPQVANDRFYPPPRT